MKIFVKVKPNAKENRIEKVDETHFKVFIKAPPKDGKANQAVIKVLSEYFNLPQSRLSIARGQTSKSKIVILL